MNESQNRCIKSSHCTLTLHARVGWQSQVPVQVLLSKRFLWSRHVVFLHTNPIGEDSWFCGLGFRANFGSRQFILVSVISRETRPMNKARQN
jgi:hypothetical protein